MICHGKETHLEVLVVLSNLAQTRFLIPSHVGNAAPFVIVVIVSIILGYVIGSNLEQKVEIACLSRILR